MEPLIRKDLEHFEDRNIGAAGATAFLFYLHGVDRDGERRVIPVHLVLLPVLLVSHGALVRGSDAEHTQDDHKHQETHAYHDDNGGSAGDHCNEQNTSAQNDTLAVKYVQSVHKQTI